MTNSIHLRLKLLGGIVLHSIFILLVWLPVRSNAQLLIKGDLKPRDTMQVHKLYTKRGDVFRGQLKEIGIDSIVFKQENADEVKFLIAKIDSLEVLSPQKTFKRRWANNFQASERLFISPTAFSLGKGRHEYRNLMLYYNSYHYGLTSNLTLGVGIIPAMVFNSAWVDIKQTYSLNKTLHVGIGAVGAAGVFYFEKKASSIGAYGVLTVGNKNNFVSFSVTRAATSLDTERGDIPPFTVSVGGSFKLWPKTRLYYEIGNHMEYLIGSVLVVGVSQQGRRRNVDYAVIMAPSKSSYIYPIGFGISRRL